MKDFALDYEKLYSLGTTKALDYLYAMVDEYAFSKRFDLIEEILVKIDLSRGPSALACGVLTITLIWDKELPGRPAFFEQARKYYEAHDKDAGAMLAGLESYQPSSLLQSLKQLRLAQYEALKALRKG